MIIKFPLFKIFFSSVFKSTASKETSNSGFNVLVFLTYHGFADIATCGQSFEVASSIHQANFC
jgi:hypothetical protein